MDYATKKLEASADLTALSDTLITNKVARANLIKALQDLDADETYTNETVERRGHVCSVIRDASLGFSGGNDTFRELGWQFVNGTWRKAA